MAFRTVNHVSVSVTENNDNSEEESISDNDPSDNKLNKTENNQNRETDSSMESSGNDSLEDHDDQVLGNAAWADAIANVLRSKTKDSTKKVILVKAKKDADVVNKEKNKFKDIEIVGENGVQVEDIDTNVVKVKKAKISVPELVKRIEIKKEWEKMGRVKPTALEKDKERALMRIGTKGVVQLFNAVQTHQRTLESKLKDAGVSEIKKDKVFKSLNKGEFLDLLKSKDLKNTAIKEESVTISETNDSSWSAGVFNENFMMGAKMKDWDKDE